MRRNLKIIFTNIKICDSGYVPVIKSVSADAEYAKFLAKADGGDYVAALSAKVCLAKADAYFSSPAFIGSANA